MDRKSPSREQLVLSTLSGGSRPRYSILDRPTERVKENIESETLKLLREQKEQVSSLTKENTEATEKIAYISKELESTKSENYGLLAKLEEYEQKMKGNSSMFSRRETQFQRDHEKTLKREEYLQRALKDSGKELHSAQEELAKAESALQSQSVLLNSKNSEIANLKLRLQETENYSKSQKKEQDEILRKMEEDNRLLIQEIRELESGNSKLEQKLQNGNSEMHDEKTALTKKMEELSTIQIIFSFISIYYFYIYYYLFHFVDNYLINCLQYIILYYYCIYYILHYNIII